MKRRERLTFLVALVTVMLVVCMGCSADLNRLLFGFVAEVRDSKGVHEFETIQAGVDYVIKRNKESGKSVSRAIEGIEEEDIVYLIRDVGEGEYGEFFRGESITVDNYGGKIGIDFQDYVYRFENDTADGKFFSILDGSEVHIRGGHTIILSNNASLEYAMIIDSPNVTLTDHWLEDRRVHGAVEGSAVYNYVNGVKIGSRGKLVINGEKTKLGSAFDLANTAKLEIENCELIKIYKLDDAIADLSKTVDGFKITGGKIEHPHKLDGKLDFATPAESKPNVKKDNFIHVPADFGYKLTNSTTYPTKSRDEIGNYCAQIESYCTKSTLCSAITSSMRIKVRGDYDPVYRGQPKTPCILEADSNWEGLVFRDSDIEYINNNAAGTATGYISSSKFSGAVTEGALGIDFEIEGGNGYGGIEVDLPDDVKIDQNKPLGNLTFTDGVVSFVKTGGDEVTQWQWNIDNGKYFIPAANEYRESSTPDSVDLVALESAGSIEKGISHKAVLYVKNRGGQTSCSMNVYMPEGELLLTLFRTKKLNNKVDTDVQKVEFEPAVHTTATAEEKATASINSWKWTLDTVQMAQGSAGTVNKLNLPMLNAGDDISAAPVVAAGLVADDFKVGSTVMHKVELTLTYWGGRASYTYKLYTQEGLSEPVEGYKVREFTDR